MRTRSPAFSDCTSASDSGVRMSLMPSVAVLTLMTRFPRRSQRHFLVPMGVAFDGDGHGERRDVARVREDVDAERRRVAAVALRPDAEPIGAREQLLLERIERRIGVR